MYAKGYKRLFWGILFTTFHITLGYINILPDFIGYIFIYFGLNILSPQQKVYKKGKIPAIILIVLTLKDVWHDPNNNVLTGQIYNLGLITMIISTIVTIIKLYLIYILCDGIYELSKERGLNELMDSAIVSWKYYFYISLICLAYVPFSINLYLYFRNFITIIVGIIQVIASIYIAAVFRKCKVELEI